MNKYAKVLVFAAIVALVVVSAQAAGPKGAAAGGLVVPDEMCALIAKMQNVFKTLRILAFVGAGFYMAAWAWDYISKGEAKLEDMKKKGIGLLVGFTLLFVIGIIISFLLSAAGTSGGKCITEGWN